MKNVLYVHGFSGGIWEAEALQQRWKCSVSAVPMPGHRGERPGERIDFDAAVELVVDRARRIHGGVDLVGYSMGARVALAALLKEPRSFGRAVLVGVRPGIQDEAQRLERVGVEASRASKLEELGIEAFMDWWETLPVIASQRTIEPRVRDRMRRARRAHWGPGLAASLRKMGAGAMPNLWPDLERLQVPTLLVTGEHDDTFSAIADAMAERTAKLSHERLPGAGHCAHWEQPEAFRLLLHRFLNRLD